MKKLTNKHGLPQPLYSAVANDSYSKGDSDVSITTLLQPPRISALKDTHADEIQEDAMDRIWALLGQSVHTILERASRRVRLAQAWSDVCHFLQSREDDDLPISLFEKHIWSMLDIVDKYFSKLLDVFYPKDTNALTEERLMVEVSGVKVSGQFDRFVLGSSTVQDYKLTSAWKIKSGQVPKDHQQQVNCYAWLLRRHGHEVLRAEIIYILRDWSKREAQRSPDYPQQQVVTIAVPIVEDGAVQQFLEGRVEAWKAAKVELPECTQEDRWARPSKFAVMKKGKKRAIRLFDSEVLAKERCAKESAGAFIEFRKGENVRCESYCSVAPFCSQFKNLKGEEK